GSLVPVGEDEHEGEAQSEEPGTSATPTPEGSTGNIDGSKDGPRTGFHLEGNVQSVQGNVMVVDGRIVYLDHVTGSAPVGARVEVNGYFTSDGRFVATSWEIKQSESEGEQKQSEQEKEKETQSETEVEVEH
ncbi:MAG TPA: DUF5666 domain-containing protein, partial [Anaerolineales bacterium]